ncbi:MAG: LysE family transporter [Candidatus Omnitrophica bacterium]|nr:LysE family transporter [Candidatus Omnitrophota bacterium]
MDYFSVFMMSFTIALSGALMPGPLLTAVIAETAKLGFKSGPFMILGHALLEALMVGLLILGLAGLASNPAVMRSIAIIGSLVLLYFGFSMLYSLPKLSLKTKGKSPKSSNLIFLGVTVSISNPYWSFWWLTIGLGLVLAAQKQGLLAVLIFFAGHITADLVWYSLVSWGISKGREFISERIYRGIILTCAAALISFSLYFGSAAFKPAF